MDEMLQQILQEVRAVRGEVNEIRGDVNELRGEVHEIRGDVNRVEMKLDAFRQVQEVTNKLLTGDTAGIESYVRDLSKGSREFRREVREWQLLTNRRIDNLEEKLTDVRDALQ